MKKVTNSSHTHCKVHIDRLLEYFCVDHDQLCCQYCRKKHLSCQNIMSLASASEGIQFSHTVSDCMKQLKALGGTCQDIINNRDRCVAVLQTDVRRLKETSSKNCSIDELENSLNEKLEENLKTLLNEKQYAYRLKREIESAHERIVFTTTHGTNEQVFILIHTFDWKLKQLESNIGNAIEGLQNITISVEDCEGKKGTSKIITVQRNPSEIIYRSAILSQAQAPSQSAATLQVFQYHSKINATGKAITGMTVTDQNVLLLCDYKYCGNETVSAYTDTGIFLKAIKMPGPVWDVAMIPGSCKAVVTFNSKILGFINTNKLIPMKSKPVLGSKHLAGVAASQNEIMVGDMGIIHFLNIHGQHLRYLKIRGWAQYLSFGSNNRLIYADHDSINCIDFSGCDIFKIQIQGENMHRKIVQDRRNNIYVTGRGTNSIQRLYADGTLDRLVVDVYNGVIDPLAICFNKDHDKLYVSNNGEKSILVFRCS